LIFDHGHGLHYALQNRVLPAVDAIRGQWVCLECGSLYGAAPRLPPIQQAVARPEACDECDSAEFYFKEYDLVDHTYRVTGHTDGFLAIGGLEGLGILEGKSISPKGAWEVRDCPKLDHYIQTQGYMWLTGATWGKIVYWDTCAHAHAAAIEHHIERDEEAIDGLKSLLQSIWQGIDGGPLASRICGTPGCDRAKDCAVSKLCFSLPSDPEVTETEDEDHDE